MNHPKLSLQSDLRRRAALRWALPHISSVSYKILRRSLKHNIIIAGAISEEKSPYNQELRRVKKSADQNRIVWSPHGDRAECDPTKGSGAAPPAEFRAVPGQGIAVYSDGKISRRIFFFRVPLDGNNIAIVESCQAFFAFEIPSVLIQERNKKFLKKVAVSGVT